MAFQLGHAALDAVLHGGNRRAVDDQHIALLLQAIGDVFTGHLARLGVVRGNGGVGAVGRHVDRHHHDPGVAGAFHRRRDTFGIGGVQDNHVDFRRDKVINLRHLLAQVVAAGDQRHVDFVPRQLARFHLRAFGNLHEKRVGEIADGDADGFEIFRLGEGAAEQRCRQQPGYDRIKTHRPSPAVIRIANG